MASECDRLDGGRTEVPAPTIPFWRRLLGDEAVITVGNRFGMGYEEDEDEVARTIEKEERELFPEAWNYSVQLWRRSQLP